MKDFIENFKESLHENLITMTFRDLARKGAELMLRLALEAEINEFIEEHRSKLMPNGCHQIVRNGYHRERTIQTRGMQECGDKQEILHTPVSLYIFC